MLDEGEGEAVLLLHGNPTWSYLWRETVQPLRAAGYRVIVPDQRGFGGSKPFGSPYDDPIEVRVADLAGLLEVLAVERVTLVLHDWGGPIGLAFAAAHPQAVRALVVIARGRGRTRRRSTPAWCRGGCCTRRSWVRTC